MKIAMMSAWNQDSGASIHAELIGREWVRMGHNLKVFSFLRSDFHGTAIVGKDEGYVTRCFTTSEAEHPFLDVAPLLEEDYDIFVTQDLGMLPKEELQGIFHIIKERSVTVTIIHHNKLPSDPSFYLFDWDGIVYFDERYHRFLVKAFPEGILYHIPYPCHPLKEGVKAVARQILGLPGDRYILLIFGQRSVKDSLGILPTIERISRHLPLLVLIVSKKDLELIRGYRGSLDILIREEAPDLERVYHYLHASDVMIYHRTAPQGAVVSSTAYQCLGSGCPILALRSGYFYNMDNVVFTYNSSEEFEDNLIEILTEGPGYHKWKGYLREFLDKNSAPIIAGGYIELFRSLYNQKAKERRAVYGLPLKGG